MREWKLFIQKAGQDTWRNIADTSLTISAGRYRLFAQTHRPVSSLEILVEYRDPNTSTLPRKQRYSRQTNQDGRVVIFPFNELQPGSWRLSCLSSAIFGVEKTRSLMINVQAAPVNSSEPLLIETEERPLTPSLSLPTAWKINLARQAFTQFPELPVVVTGELCPPAHLESTQSNVAQLHFQLHHAITGECVADEVQPVLLSTSSLKFQQQFSLPEQTANHRWLGEVALKSGGQILVQSTFTVLTQSTDARSNLATNLVSEDRRKRLDLFDPSLIKTPRNIVRPALGSILPPKVSSKKGLQTSIQLPKITHPVRGRVPQTRQEIALSRAFAALNVRDRFLNRLNYYAQEPANSESVG
ncbi:MAG: hypothetical protein AAGG02_13680 [Cyanobacteria bacterium P01_H01_bin.15]